MTHRVLIVDDDPERRETLKALLARRRLAQDHAETLAEGVQRAHEEGFSCVLLALCLPDSLDPYGTVEAIPDFAPIPVVVSTGHEDPRLMRACMKHGASFALGGSPLQLVQYVLQAIERRDPSPEVERHLIAVSREREKNEKDSGVLRWVPALSFSLALLVATLTGAAFLVRSIVTESRRAQESEVHFQRLDQVATEFKGEITELRRQSNDMQAKLGIAEQDRAAIRRELLTVGSQQEKYQTDVVRRLERIEDSVLSLLKQDKRAQ